ncbi:glutaminyl-peptide cyclotransferase [uncultured Alistipes sp.]|uniref:glutaminyl-peptide cyclotransferase n=1 Tax=uncultured Alistipes sp. TaxID=538949 RepID=UPI00280510ED|nr:glutaminyl-peptide cyclotransferase [uncultured Alistipes sp.]
MMKLATILLLAATLLSGCGSSPARSRKAPKTNTVEKPAPEPRQYSYRIKAVYPHSTQAYTQGLLWHDGRLWEGTGQNGESVVQTLSLETGESRVLTRLPRSEFGEGIAILGDELFQLTWQSNTVHVYRITEGGRLEKIRDHRYPGEGWGITTNGRKLYMSDGSSNLYTVDPATFRREGHVTVTFRGEPVSFLNELEWIDGRIWANVYTTDQIVIIDPATGRIEGVVDLTGLLPDEDRTPKTDVLNGIAWDPDAKRLFVTGKNWCKLFEIEIIEQ